MFSLQANQREYPEKTEQINFDHYTARYNSWKLRDQRWDGFIGLNAKIVTT